MTEKYVEVSGFRKGEPFSKEKYPEKHVGKYPVPSVELEKDIHYLLNSTPQKDRKQHCSQGHFDRIAYDDATKQGFCVKQGRAYPMTTTICSTKSFVFPFEWGDTVQVLYDYRARKRSRIRCLSLTHVVGRIYMFGMRMKSKGNGERDEDRDMRMIFIQDSVNKTHFFAIWNSVRSGETYIDRLYSIRNLWLERHTKWWVELSNTTVDVKTSVVKVEKLNIKCQKRPSTIVEQLQMLVMPNPEYVVKFDTYGTHGALHLAKVRLTEAEKLAAENKETITRRDYVVYKMPAAAYKGTEFTESLDEQIQKLKRNGRLANDYVFHIKTGNLILYDDGRCRLRSYLIHKMGRCFAYKFPSLTIEYVKGLLLQDEQQRNHFYLFWIGIESEYIQLLQRIQNTWISRGYDQGIYEQMGVPIVRREDEHCG